jgi:hypothetical protein
VKIPTDPDRLQRKSTNGSGCPFGRQCYADPSGASSAADPRCDAEYSEARRQGIYLAACIIDEVAALGASSPEAVVDEIRRRIGALVRHEFNGYAVPGEGYR